MYSKTLDLEGVDLDEARKQLPRGLLLVSEQVLCDGSPETHTGIGDTVDLALEAARAKVTDRTLIVGERVIESPGSQTVVVTARNEKGAKKIAVAGRERPAKVERVSLTEAGRKRFLWPAKNTYEVFISWPATAQVVERRNARLEVSVCESSLLLKSQRTLVRLLQLETSLRTLCDEVTAKFAAESGSYDWGVQAPRYVEAALRSLDQHVGVPFNHLFRDAQELLTDAMARKFEPLCLAPNLTTRSAIYAFHSGGWRKQFGAKVDEASAAIAALRCLINAWESGLGLTQTALADIARTDPDSGVRGAAVERLSDQQVLVDIARTDADSGVRGAAVQRLGDQAVLAHVAKTDSDRWVRQAAVGRLNDQPALARIAKTDSDFEVRRLAVQRLDPKQNDDLRRAMWMLEGDVPSEANQALLADVARLASQPKTRRAAVARLSDQTVLADVAKNDPDGNVRQAAVERLKNEPALAGHEGT